MTDLVSRLERFRASLLTHLAAIKAVSAEVADELFRAGELLDSPIRSAEGRVAQRQPATAFLGAALASGLSGPVPNLSATIQDLAPDLSWTYSYPKDPQRPNLGQRIAFADVLGRGGLAPIDHVLVGLTLIAPNTLYPLHRHPAVELYLVVSGTARWQAGSDPLADRRPGSLILHPSGVPHATEAGAEPLLAVYLWRGDLASPSVFC